MDPNFLKKTADEIDRLEENHTSDGMEEYLNEIPLCGRQADNFLEQDIDDWLDNQV